MRAFTKHPCRSNPSPPKPGPSSVESRSACPCCTETYSYLIVSYPYTKIAARHTLTSLSGSPSVYSFFLGGDTKTDYLTYGIY